jgi:hypothetical protein
MLAAPFALLLPLPLKIAVDSVIGARPLLGFLAVVLPGGFVISSGGRDCSRFKAFALRCLPAMLKSSCSWVPPRGCSVTCSGSAFASYDSKGAADCI